MGLIPIWVVLAILGTHFVADFVLQNDWMALNKSKRLLPLAAHVAVYSAGLIWLGWKFAALNGVLHFVVDYVTSRVTARLWEKGQRHLFFVVIGLDQYTHQVCLFLSAGLSWWLTMKS